MVGILNGTLFIWVVFFIGYAALIIILSLKIYYLNFVIYGIHQFQMSYQASGFCKEIFVPLRKGKSLNQFLYPTLINRFSSICVGPHGQYHQLRHSRDGLVRLYQQCYRFWNVFIGSVNGQYRTSHDLLFPDEGRFYAKKHTFQLK